MKTWWLGHLFGMMGISFTILDAVTVKDWIYGMPAGFRFSIIFFSLVYTFFQSLRAYERWQSERIDNHKKRIELQQMKKEFSSPKNK